MAKKTQIDKDASPCVTIVYSIIVFYNSMKIGVIKVPRDCITLSMKKLQLKTHSRNIPENLFPDLECKKALINFAV